MLRITESESVEAAKEYFKNALTKGDYYFDGQEVVGAWGGRGADKLNLRGEVTQEAFFNLLENKRADGSKLTARTVTNRRPGYDFTFDVPKSVSIVHALNEDERIVKAMENAIRETMREIEKDMHVRVRKQRAFEDRRTGNMIWGDFIHFTARPAPLTQKMRKKILKEAPAFLQKQPDTFTEKEAAKAQYGLNTFFRNLEKKSGASLADMQLHAHVFALNASWDEKEKMWKAGEFSRIIKNAPYYQAAYHSRLASKLQELGYDIQGTANAFEIVGINRSTIEKFSRRKEQVERAAQLLGITDADRKAELGAHTRAGKQSNLSRSEIKVAWNAMLDADEKASLQKVKARMLANDESQAIDNPFAASKAVTYSLEHEFERVSEKSEKRVLATALERAVGQASFETVTKAFKSNRNVIRADVNGEARITTKDVLAEEKELMDMIRLTRGNEKPLVYGDYAFKEKIFRDEKVDTSEQKNAILHVLKSNDWAVGLIGRAGTGKTTLLREIRAAMREEKRNLVLCAPTSEASRGVLRKEGFANADTVKRLLADEDLQKQMKGGILWVDEAGMVGNRDLLELMKTARRNGAAKVVLAGDPRQIRSVPRGDALRFLEERAGLSVARLDNIRRQRDPELKQAVEAVSRGEMNKGFSILDRKGAIVEADKDEAHQLLADAYVSASKERKWNGQRKSALVVSTTHQEGEEVTKAIRESLKKNDMLVGGDRQILRTMNLSMTEAQKANSASYEPGMMVEFKKNIKGFKKGERTLVILRDEKPGKVFLQNNFGDFKKLPANDTKAFQVYAIKEISVCPGDRLRITEGGRAMDGRSKLDAGRFVTLKGFDKNGNMNLENGKTISKHFGNLTHGYCTTADAAQSKTVDSVFAAIGKDSMGATDMRRFYVTISRARDKAKVFTDDREALMSAIQRDDKRRHATDIHELRNQRLKRIAQFINPQELIHRARNRMQTYNKPNHSNKVIERQRKAAQRERCATPVVNPILKKRLFEMGR